MELPDFEQVRIPKGLILIRKGFKEFLIRQEGCGLEHCVLLLEPAPQTLHGRRQLSVRILPNHSRDRVVIKHFSHGSPLRFLTRDLFFGRARSFNELVLTEHARANGVPTLTIIAAQSRRAFWLFHKDHIISLMLHNASDLATTFEQLSILEPNEQSRMKRNLLAVLAETIRKLHDCGISHCDLNMKNLLVQESENTLKVFVIDLDRSLLRSSPLPLEERLNNILRLARSCIKLNRNGKFGMSNTDALRFAKYYFGQKDFKWRIIKRHIRRFLSSLRWHRLWWKIWG